MTGMTFAILPFTGVQTGEVRRLEFVFEAKYSREFNTVYFVCHTDESASDQCVAVTIAPSALTGLRVSFTSHIVSLANLELQSCVPVTKLAPFDDGLAWRFSEYLALSARRKLALWFKKTFGYEAVPDYRSIVRSVRALFENDDLDDDTVVHYLFSDDLDLVGFRRKKESLWKRLWRKCRS